MTNGTLEQYYKAHNGKVSDKWSSYLIEYERILKEYRDKPVRLLEIGIQNGGSLEIWRKYFPDAQKLVGCDINPDCIRLAYDDPRIRVVIGDANSDAVQAEIFKHSHIFDIIIDDGSHRSSDIVKSFAKYFPHLADEGIFIAEDLHCSYWQGYEGGLFDPFSSIGFFKRLADIINYEHWGVQKKNIDILEGFFSKYGFRIDEELLQHIHSVEFVNSICIIRKSKPELNRLGARYIAGSVETVMPGHLDLHTTLSSVSDESGNDWTMRAVPPDEELLHRLKQIADLERTLADLKQTLEERDQKLSSLTQSLAARDQQLEAIYHSTSWRMTMPLRWTMHQIKRAKRVSQLAMPAIRQSGGLKNAIRKAAYVYRKSGLEGIKRSFRTIAANQQTRPPNANSLPFLQKISHEANELIELRILIIAELSIPQCTKYRVKQKQEMFESLGVQCSIHNWTDTNACFNALSTHSLVIFYRVPAFQSSLDIIAEAKRLKIPTFWEVDDLIFDREILAASRTLLELEQSVFDGLLEGADLYRKAMLACDKAIASTTGLSQAMQKAGVSQVFVVENALDQQTLISANRLNGVQNKSLDGIVRVVYGSGTNTHNADFKEASSAILHILGAFPNVRFRLIGKLDLPAAFSKYESQIERIPLCNYDEYLSLLAECDISIAPLENYIFNDAKSNIKFLEASILRLPSVCSPRAAFCQAINHRVNGFLCETEAEWVEALTLLIKDSQAREQIGFAAYASVLDTYSTKQIAERQLLPFLKEYRRTPKKAIRILSVNIYYSPRTFGGATIVAEEINKLLNNRSDFEVYAFTTLPSAITLPYALRRYEADGVPVFGMGLPEGLDTKTQFENENVINAFEDVISAVQPDFVHLHSIQGIGVLIANLCKERNIPYVITLHDSWWVCGRQFMINKQGKYCGQEKIDLAVCARCVDTPDLNNHRQAKLHEVMQNASLLLAPSKFSADFYRKNSIAPNKIILNRNGIYKPAIGARERQPRPLTFGYVGGNSEVKGVHLVHRVFAELDYSNNSLVIVDNAVNLGFSSYEKNSFKGIKNVRIIPAYTKETIDSFFSSIDVLLFPTQCKESFGLTVREALIRNVWVISTDAGGATENIIPGKNGFIIPLNDNGEALKQAVLNTAKFYEERFPVGATICLESEGIISFEDQANELAYIFKKLSGDMPPPIKIIPLRVAQESV